MNESKFCHGCGKVRPVDQFASKPGRSGKRTRASRCKDCQREWQAAYRLEHGDHVNENARQAYARDPSRKKASKSDFYQRHRDELLPLKRERYAAGYAVAPERWHAAKSRRKARLSCAMDATDRLLSLMYRHAIRDEPCFYCGRRVSGDMHTDHYFPLAKGGTDHWWNLVRACGPCNRRKHAACGTRFFLMAGGAGGSRCAPAVEKAAPLDR